MEFKKPEKIKAEAFTNRFTMIVGDINSGKTTLTQKILEVFCRTTDSTVTVVDLAPEITPQDLGVQDKAVTIGGRLRIPVSRNVRYYHPLIHPPRLRSRDECQAEALAAENSRTIDALFAKVLPKNRDAIFINDCSLYLHSGNASKFLEMIRTSQTSLVNGYLGRFFNSSSISIKERKGMEFLMLHCDRLIKLS